MTGRDHDGTAGHRLLDGGGQALGIAGLVGQRVLEEDAGPGQPLPDEIVVAGAVEEDAVRQPMGRDHRLAVGAHLAVADDLEPRGGRGGRGLREGLERQQRGLLGDDPPDRQQQVGVLLARPEQGGIDAGRDYHAARVAEAVAGKIVDQELRDGEDPRQPGQGRRVAPHDLGLPQPLRGIEAAEIGKDGDPQRLPDRGEPAGDMTEFAEDRHRMLPAQELLQLPAGASEGNPGDAEAQVSGGAPGKGLHLPGQPGGGADEGGAQQRRSGLDPVADDDRLPAEELRHMPPGPGLGRLAENARRNGDRGLCGPGRGHSMPRTSLRKRCRAASRIGWFSSRRR